MDQIGSVSDNMGQQFRSICGTTKEAILYYFGQTGADSIVLEQLITTCDNKKQFWNDLLGLGTNVTARDDLDLFGTAYAYWEWIWTIYNNL